MTLTTFQALLHEKAMGKVKAMKTTMSTTMQGMAISVEITKQRPSNFVSNVSMNGMTIEKQVYNGKAGKSSGMQGEREMNADDLAKMISDRYPGRNITIEVSEDGENGCICVYKGELVDFQTRVKNSHEKRSS